MMRRVFLVLLALCVLQGCRRAEKPRASGVLTVSKELKASWVRNFNPFSPGGPRWPTRAGIYEPLAIHSSGQDAWVPWLATSWEIDEDARRVTFTIRDNVRWSDGEPFGADDVVYTFNLLLKNRALDMGGLASFLSTVKKGSGNQVIFEFDRPYMPGFEDIAGVPIVAQHIWQKVEDPLAYANPDPVGTGPFTEVLRFTRQVFELGKNPHYWQPGKPKVDVLRFPAFIGNDQANLALVTGEIDWGGNFVPAIERTFVERDPEHHRYWFPLTGDTVFLYANAAKTAFKTPAVRKALSMAIDRELLVRVAAYDLSRPSDSTAMSDLWKQWKSESSTTESWVRYDPRKAKEILSDSGLSGEAFEIVVVSGWSDWVRAAQVIARQLREVGLDVRVRVLEFTPWMQAMQTGDFDLGIGWSLVGATPYRFYRGLMSKKRLTPLGETASENWHRFGDARADTLLGEFERARTKEEQVAIVKKLSSLFEELAPAIPLYPNPVWGTYSTKRFRGFPSNSNPYAALSPNKEPECLLVLTELEPVGER